MMNAVISYKPATGADVYGGTAFGVVVTGVPALVLYRNRIIRMDVEDRILSTATIWCPPAGFVTGVLTVPRINPEDQVQLADDSIWRHVLVVEAPGDESGSDHHQKIALT